MSWFNRKRAKQGPGLRQAVDALGYHVCDICNDELDLDACYWLTTAQVVVSEAYWVDKLATAVRVMGPLVLVDGKPQIGFFNSSVELAGRHDTPWAVCERCSPLFMVDRDEARQYALGRTAPPGCQPVPPGDYVLIAARAWEQVFGQWPSSVTQPAAGTSDCPACGKKLYRDEIVYGLTAEVFENWCVAGYFGREPQQRPQPGAVTDPNAGALENRWTVCQSCAALGLAGLHRDKQRET